MNLCSSAGDLPSASAKDDARERVQAAEVLGEGDLKRPFLSRRYLLLYTPPSRRRDRKLEA